MNPIDTVARAELSRIKVQLHQMTTAMFASIDALDRAFKSVENILGSLEHPPNQIDAAEAGEEIERIRRARAQILNTRTLLRPGFTPPAG